MLRVEKDLHKCYECIFTALSSHICPRASVFTHTKQDVFCCRQRLLTQVFANTSFTCSSLK